MPNPAPLSLAIGKGEARTFSGVHQKSQSDSSPVNIFGWTILVTITDQSGNQLAQKTASVTGDGTAGAYTWALTATDSAIAAQRTQIDVWRTDVGSESIMAIGTLDITGNPRKGN
jgi:hypothetical protein